MVTHTKRTQRKEAREGHHLYRRLGPYVVNAFNKHWIDGWKKRGWKTANKQPVKNRDLWERLLAAKSKHKVEFIWVKGHAGHELNERCDELATTAADGSNLDIDTGFNESDL